MYENELQLIDDNMNIIFRISILDITYDDEWRYRDHNGGKIVHRFNVP